MITILGRNRVGRGRTKRKKHEEISRTRMKVINERTRERRRTNKEIKDNDKKKGKKVERCTTMRRTKRV